MLVIVEMDNSKILQMEFATNVMLTVLNAHPKMYVLLAFQERFFKDQLAKQLAIQDSMLMDKFVPNVWLDALIALMPLHAPLAN